MGERITYFEKASEMLNNATKLAKNLDNDVVRLIFIFPVSEWARTLDLS
jgi:hypothetical protein